MTKYKDLPEKEVAGRFAPEEEAYKRYGKEEVILKKDEKKSNIPLADFIAKIYREGEDITEKEYLAK